MDENSDNDGIIPFLFKFVLIVYLDSLLCSDDEFNLFNDDDDVSITLESRLTEKNLAYFDIYMEYKENPNRNWNMSVINKIINSLS